MAARADLLYRYCSRRRQPQAGAGRGDAEVGAPYGRLARSLGGEPLGKLDDQPFRTADIAEPIAVLVIPDLADRVEALVPQAGDDRVVAVDLERDVPAPSRFTGMGCAPWSSAGAWYLTSSSLPLPSGVRTNTSSARTPSSPLILSTTSPAHHPALLLEAQAEEERGHGVQVIDHNTHMLETQHAHSSHSFDIAARWDGSPPC